MAGTGLPIPKAGDQRSTAPNFVDADQFSSAAAWGRIAEAGQRLAKTGLDSLEAEVQRTQAGYLADQEIEISKQRAILRDKHANDPAAFDAAWTGYTDGKLAEAQPWAVNHLKKRLGVEGNGAYSSILSEKRSLDHTRDVQRFDALSKQSGDEVIGSAMAGTLATPEGQSRIVRFKSILDSAVSTGLMVQEKADLILEDTLSKAQGEVAAREGVDVYRQKGFDAAVDHLKKSILENEGLSLKGDARYKAFNRGLSAIRLQQAQDKEDRASTIEVSRDLRARIDSNQPYDVGEVRDTLRELQRTGGAAEYHRLSVAAAVREATEPYRNGLKLREFASVVQGRRASAEPDLGRLRQIESGGNPNAVSPTGAKGPYQFTDATAARYGLTDPFNEPAAADAVKRLWADNAVALQSSLGRQPTGGELYLAHQQGAAGAAALLRDPSANAVDALTQAYGGDRAKAARAILVNGGSADMTAGQFAQKWIAKYEGDGGSGPSLPPGVPYPGETAARIQKVFVEQARKAWPSFKQAIQNGQVLDSADLDAVQYGAMISGDAAWTQEVNSLVVANRIGQTTRTLPATQQQAAADEVRAAARAGGWAVDEEQLTQTVQKQFQRQTEMARNDPVGYAIERGRQPPAPLDFRDAGTARAAVEQRVALARGVAADQEIAPGSPFRPADKAAIAGAIGGDPRAAQNAFDALAGLPDEMLSPALAAPEIKAAVTGAVRAADPAKFSAAMQFMDRMWSRSPETAAALFGKESIEQLMTWQSNLRYMTPEQLAKERERSALDPQVRQRMKVDEQAGRELARKAAPEEIVKQFDTSWWPGPVARAMGAQPLPPDDTLTRAAFLGDYENQYARLYAQLNGNADEAQKQAVALLKTKWHRSPTNGGRLMVNAPETVRGPDGMPFHPAVGGSYDWMRKQVEDDIGRELGRPKWTTVGPEEGGAGTQNWDYTLVSDRQTAAEAANGRPPSYQVIVTDAATGRATTLGRRFAFDPAPAVGQARVDFEEQRRRARAVPALVDGLAAQPPGANPFF